MIVELCEMTPWTISFYNEGHEIFELVDQMLLDEFYLRPYNSNNNQN